MKFYVNIAIKVEYLWCSDDVSTHVSMNYDIQADAIGFDKCPRLYPILAVIFGKPGKLNKQNKLDHNLKFWT